MDSAADPAFDDPFMRAMVDSVESAVMISPEPEFGQLVEIIQNATGSVATGDVKPEDAADKYRDELKRVLGEENTTTEP
jgi:ABC-type glycerol-3-phosphate transport system substrate-binding protein